MRIFDPAMAARCQLHHDRILTAHDFNAADFAFTRTSLTKTKV
jgi:hypothetical protein